MQGSYATNATGRPPEDRICLHHLVTDAWMKCLWFQCQHLNIHIQMDLLDFYLLQQGDVELMELFARHWYRKEGLCTIN